MTLLQTLPIGLTGETLFAVLIFGPLLAAVLAVIAPGAARGTGLLASGVIAAAAVGLVLAVRTGPIEIALGGWIEPLGIVLFADGLSALMIALTAGIGLVVAIYADTLFTAARRGKPTSARVEAGRLFWPIWLILACGMNALFLSRDVFNMYVEFELISLAAVALAAMGGGVLALKAALGYLLAGLAGSLLFLLGIDFLYAAHGEVTLAALSRGTPDANSLIAIALVVSGLLLKAALFPLHFWMPAAHANAMSPASAILSALVVKAALYIVVRLFGTGNPALDAVGLVIGAMGAAAIVWGSVQALRARRLKLVVAYSTVAQIGLISMAFALAGSAGAEIAWRGAVMLILAHGVAKAAMFLAVGRMAEVMGHDRLAGLNRAGPAAAPALAAFAIAAVSLIGLPPSAGFIGKWLLLEAGLTSGAWLWLVVLVLSTALSAAYLWRVVSRGLQTAAFPAKTTRRWHTGDALAIGLAVSAIALGLGAAGPLGLLETGSLAIAAAGAS